MRAEELEIRLDTLTLAAKAWGDPARPPMLALHGWLDNAGSFDRLAPQLAAERYLVALDLPGHGRSQHRPHAMRYHFVDYFDELREVFRRFGWTRAGMLGHSLGGALASLFAAAFPELVGELVLIEGLGPLTTKPEDTLKQLRGGLDERPAANETALRIYADVAAAAKARRRANGLSEAAALALMERGLRPVDGGFTWSTDPRLMLPSLQRYTEAQVLAMLSGLRARTLLILAEPETHLVGAEAMAARVAHVRGIEVARLPGNHHLHLEHADAVAERILAFLRASADTRASAHAQGEARD